MPGLGEFVATADSEASDAEIPHFKGDAGADVPPDAPSRVGMAPMEDVAVEEVEEEDPNVHFKRKRQGGSRRKRGVKKPRRYTPTVIAEGESAAVLPPPAPLVIKLSAPRQTVDKAAPDLCKISSILATYTYIYFIQFIRLSYDSGTETARESRAEAIGEQGDYYDPLFTYKEGDEASYFIASEDSEVTRLTSVLRVLGPPKEVPWPLTL